jgi:hypothetical protein
VWEGEKEILRANEGGLTMKIVKYLSSLLSLLGLIFSSVSYAGLTTSPTSKDFGNVTVGSSSTSTFTISNTGTSSVTRGLHPGGYD